MPHKDEIKGKTQAVKGRVKEAVGNLVGDDRTAREGRVDQVAGNARAAVGAVKRHVANVVKDVKQSGRAAAGAVSRQADDERARRRRP
jgi:uncharacterized protein YjbJ (UPF0337 family)